MLTARTCPIIRIEGSVIVSHATKTSTESTASPVWVAVNPVHAIPISLSSSSPSLSIPKTGPWTLFLTVTSRSVEVVVDARSERFSELPGLGVFHLVPSSSCCTDEIHPNMKAIGGQCALTNDGRELAAHLPADEIHLKQTVSSLCVPSREIQRIL